MTDRRTLLAIAALLLLAAPLPAADPPSASESVRLALRDARGLNPVAAGRTRYLSGHVTAAARPADLAGLDAVLRGLLPSLGTGTNRSGLRAVASVRVAGKPQPWLWAFDAADYGIDLTVWANLRFADVVYHEATGDRHKNPVVPEYVPQLELKELAALLQTAAPAPIFPAEYVVERTAQQTDRLGDGYYDFLGLKDFAAAEALAGVDRAKAEAADADRRAFLQHSRVGLQPRDIAVYEARHGRAWYTFDRKEGTGARNVVKNLDRAVSDGGMAVATLPNRLAFNLVFAADGRGGFKLADSAPDDIAGHRDGVALDTRVHPGQCWHCHRDGNLRAFTNGAPAFYNPAAPFVSRDDARARRVKAVYLSSDPEHLLEEDAARFDRAMAQAAGVGYREWGKLHRAVLEARRAPVDLAGAAADTGYPAAAVRKALDRFRTREGPGNNDPVAEALLTVGVRRELYDEARPRLMAILRQELK